MDFNPQDGKVINYVVVATEFVVICYGGSARGLWSCRGSRVFLGGQKAWPLLEGVLNRASDSEQNSVFQGCWLCRHPWRAVWREAARAPSQESWCIRKQTGSSWATAHQPLGPSPGCGRPEPQGSRRACAGLELTSLFAQVSVGTASFPGFYCFSSAVTKIHCAAQSASSLCSNIYI